jgi:CO/xanthine dehydrogenase FAD-binding subunit
MRAHPFSFLAPSSYSELLAAAKEHAEDGKLLAGGQSLLPMLTLRLLRPAVVIAIGDHLNGEIRLEGRDLIIPAGTRHATLVRDPLVRTWLPSLGQAAHLVGNSRVRNRGTIGGSLSHSDATAELPCVLSALEARIVVASTSGAREIAAEKFIVSWFTPALEPGEVVQAIRVPVRRSKQAFVEIARRSGDFAIVEVGVSVLVDEADAIGSARVVVGGVGDRPVLFEQEPTAVLRQEADPILAGAKLGSMIAGSIDPYTDHRASGVYRRSLVSVLVSDAIVSALSARAAA